MIANETGAGGSNESGGVIGDDVGVGVVLMGDGQVDPGVFRKGSGGDGISGDESGPVNGKDIRVGIPEGDLDPGDILAGQGVQPAGVGPAVGGIDGARAGKVVLINAIVADDTVEGLINL